MVTWCQTLVQRWANLILNISPCWNMKLDDDGTKGFSDNGSNLLDQCVPLYFMLLLLILMLFLFISLPLISWWQKTTYRHQYWDWKSQWFTIKKLHKAPVLFCFLRFRLVLSGCLILFYVQCAPIGCLTLQYTHCHALGFNWIDWQGRFRGTQTD